MHIMNVNIGRHLILAPLITNVETDRGRLSWHHMIKGISYLFFRMLENVIDQDKNPQLLYITTPNK